MALSLLPACSPISDEAPGSNSDDSGAGQPNHDESGMSEPEDSTVIDPVERAQARVTRQVIDLEGVTGTAMGLCNGKPCIKIYVDKSSAELQARLPRSEAGYPVVVEVTGKIRRP